VQVFKELSSRVSNMHEGDAFQCTTLTMKEVKDLYNIFYKCDDKLKQDAFLLKYCSVNPIL
jgi:NADH:ubiquinone oxidoreductase subunit D